MPNIDRTSPVPFLPKDPSDVNVSRCAWFSRRIQLVSVLRSTASAVLRSPRATAATVIVWSLCAAAGIGFSIQYENTPSPMNDGPREWPAESACGLSTQRPTLLMFVHPQCPCSRASLNELAILMNRCQDRVTTQVLFLHPSPLPTEWSMALWDRTKEIPSVIQRLDHLGIEHQRFGARTSGEVFLYLPDGQLVFHGGITAGRGHAGDSVGRAALESFLMNQSLPVSTTPVFGCDLADRSCQSETCGLRNATRARK